jgi:ATP-dependent helicase/nuclease subunit A
LSDAARRAHALTLRSAFAVRPGATVDSIDAELAQVISEDLISVLVEALRGGSSRDLKQAERLQGALVSRSDAQRVVGLTQFFLTDKGKPRDSLITKSVASKRPDAVAIAERTQERFRALFEEREGLRVVEASCALVHLAGEVEARYSTAKAMRAALDYGDLIVSAARLLERSESAQWVLYKLDGGLDHILVDEAQDTSPTQWRIVASLAAEFFSGDGAQEAARTLFAVGDEKQSIYGFQGAAPRLFAAMGALFEQRARAAGRRLHMLPLTRSFRSTEPVLSSVDRVFSGDGGPRGVTSSGTATRHEAHRIGQAGLVEMWDTETAQKAEPGDVWAPARDERTTSPVERLADRIATTIRAWLDRGEMLESEGRPIRASDILILVRKRTPFAAPMIRALKTHKVPVAGADRIRIAETLAVMDVLALADFILMPEDDLALATVLKSPICGLDDDALFALAASRKGALWTALNAHAQTAGPLARVVGELRQWRKRADFDPPFEFLATLLDTPRAGGSVRERLVARLGPEAADALDELLGLALQFDERHVPSLQAFVDWMREGGAEIKRDMEHGGDMVRVMTVHGAKGLEAPIVFLADTCTTAALQPGQALADLADREADSAEAPAVLAWAVKGTGDLAAISRARQRQLRLDMEEYNRLLYVAMTRARDRLYICGFEGAQGRQRGCWYDTLETQLAPVLTTMEEEGGRRVRRLRSAQTAHAHGRPAGPRATSIPPLPPWVSRPVPPEPAVAIPLAPSRLAPLETEADEPNVPAPIVPDEQRVQPPAAPGLRDPLQRGVLTHMLLEYLPACAADGGREALGRKLLAARVPEAPERAREAILREVMAVLRDPVFASLFGPEARAEVPLVAELKAPGEQSRSIRLTGQIDRLLVTPYEILIVDYKSNRQPPLRAQAVAEAYILQLAAYRLALRAIYPDRPVKAALLWTATTTLMPVPDALLDSAEPRLWKLGLTLRSPLPT